VVRVNGEVTERLRLSVAVIVNCDRPGTSGVPLIWPDVLFSSRPDGREPPADQV
jgi:hypothetical protein